MVSSETADLMKIWNATSIITGYFYAFGGARSYPGMELLEEHLYIGCRLMKMYDPQFDPGRYVSKSFLDAAAPVLQAADDQIDAITAKGDALFELILGFVESVNHRLKRKNISRQWSRFVEAVGKERGQTDQGG